VLLSVTLNPKRQGVPQSPMLFLASRGKPYLRPEGCPLICWRSPTRPLSVSARVEHLTSAPSYVQRSHPACGSLQGGVLTWTDTPTYPHDHHAPPASHKPPLRPGIPLFQRSAPAPSYHAASTGHAHRLPPPRLITTPGSAPRTLRSARALFLASDPTQRASSYVPLRVHRVTVAPTPSYAERVTLLRWCSQ
jgi:hypothetical protein